jgi:methylmalonyl-CoA/ethylmalonyl-CoA epimerase
MLKIEHIGIAVKNLKQSSDVYAKLLGTSVYKQEEVKSESVNTAFLQVGNEKIELLEATSETSSIVGFLERKGEGIHHIAFLVEDIVLEMERLKGQGFTLLSDIPKIGADNKLVFFVHPKDANGVLIEICQEIKR